MKPLTIVVVGAAGMLGRHVLRESLVRGHTAHGYSRGQYSIEYYSRGRDILAELRPDIVINCVGALPGASLLDMVNANTTGPHFLSNLCRQYGSRLIHVSTDCVYSGEPDPSDPGRRYSSKLHHPDPDTAYGRTKLAGEPYGAHVLTIRTSFVGREAGLGAWLLSQPPGSVVQGWERAWWSGTGVPTIANRLLRLAENFEPGLLHVASAEKVNKAWLLRHLTKLFDRRDVRVESVQEPAVDRALKTDYLLPPIEEALRDV